MTWREKIRAGMALNKEVTNFWIEHPNDGWIETDCACTAVDVSSFLRSIGDEPWRITLGPPVCVCPEKGCVIHGESGDTDDRSKGQGSSDSKI